MMARASEAPLARFGGTTSAAHAMPKGSSSSRGATSGVRVGIVVPLPAVLQFAAGTRLWIRVFSISRQPDGSFNFGGTLLEPVSQAGLHLDKDTVLSGSGNVKGNDVTVLIRSFLIRGVSYSLPGTIETLSPQTPGAGKALQFDDGQIIEMWVSSATVYEKAVAEVSPSRAKP
jgi:hypothetical protein